MDLDVDADSFGKNTIIITSVQLQLSLNDKFNMGVRTGQGGTDRTFATYRDHIMISFHNICPMY